MLHRLSADHSNFKALSFKPGLNILLATRVSNELQVGSLRSRNGAGKSSVVDIVHFLLGGKAEGALTSTALEDWKFTLDLDVGPARLSATRCVKDGKNISLEASDGTSRLITNTKWCETLGEEWFGLTKKRERGGATFRQLFSYFVRRKRDGALDNPTRTFRAQKAASSETALAELFGLDSALVRHLHQIKISLRQTKDAQRALSDLDKNAAAGSKKADLEAQLEAQIAAVRIGRNRLREQIETFNVLPAFRDLEVELANLNNAFRDLSDHDIIDTESIEINKRTLEDERIIDKPDLSRLFSEARIIFPEIVTDRYSEVQKFHEYLVRNRQSHLQAEIEAAQRRIRGRDLSREEVESRRREIITALRASGPAEELLQLRDELSEREAALRQLEGRLQEAQRIEKSIEKLSLDLEDAVRALRQDRRERASIVEMASATFSEISERLYEKPGSLAISATDAGLRFLPTTPADASAGVMSMEIFCFDLTIATLARRRGEGPGFIIHDSHLFEPVDGRQFARALQIADDFAKSEGIQYIALLNSDELERAERESGVSFTESIIKTELSDTQSGGLFGLRFD